MNLPIVSVVTLLRSALAIANLVKILGGGGGGGGGVRMVLSVMEYQIWFRSWGGGGGNRSPCQLPITVT